MNVLLGGDVAPQNAGTEIGVCGICYDQVELLNLCAHPVCCLRFCNACWVAHIRSTVEAALYAVPQVKCPSCATRVSTANWFRHVQLEIRSKYMENARVLLSVRCCGIASFFQSEPVMDLASVEKSITAGMSAFSKEQLRHTWVRYLRGDQKSDAFLEDLLQILPNAQHEADAVERLGRPYQYPPALEKLPSAISDPERRTAFQLAFLQRFPKTRTPCCGARVCFRCKTYDWHQETCEERQRKEMGHKVCFCPHCGVPTVKSEGCDHMVCVCGRDWTWGVDPLVSMLQDGNGSASAVERLLKNLEDINAPLDGWHEPPMDLFLRYMQPGPDSIEIVKVFAKLGARASPLVHRDRLFEACHDLDLLKLLLEHFRGVSLWDLTEMLSESILCVCRLVRSKFGLPEFRREELARQAKITALLIEHGAFVGEAATKFYKLPSQQRTGCLVELEKLLAMSPQGLGKADVADPLDDKLTRANQRCASKLHDNKHRTHVNSRYAQKRTARPRGGKRKCGYLEADYS